MTILGIDTSFDDTAAAVVADQVILSNVLSSQLDIHQQWGGVVPRLARTSHETFLPSVVATALKRAHLTFDELDAIAVTQGPGLSITLEIGIQYAKDLALQYHKPLIAVNHMEGHLLSFLCRPHSHSPSITPLELSSLFPFMGVLVSGGHTQFVLCSALGQYEIVGETQDDAMGEAFDKVGRMLGLGYPAGALIEQFAREGKPGAFSFPIPMHAVKSAATSYSGLKTAASRLIAGKDLTRQTIADLALAFQTAATTHLLEKLDFALNQHPVKALVAGGGVIANLTVRQRLRALARTHQLPLYLPYTKKLCVDNAVMIALVGAYKAARSEYFSDPSTLDRLPNMRLGA